MKIFVKVRAKSKQEKIEKIDDSHFKVFVKAPAQDGKANQAIIKVLADYFNMPQGQIRIISGQSSKQKILEISL
jgi:uncharacterized protein (TIGR00251 family)